MKRKLTNDPLEFFRTLPHVIKLKIYRFTIHVFDSRRELIEAVDLYVQTRYGDDRQQRIPSARSSRWPKNRPIGEWDVSRVTDFSQVFSFSRNRSTKRFNEDLSLWDVSNGTNFVEICFGIAIISMGTYSNGTSPTPRIWVACLMAASFSMRTCRNGLSRMRLI
jgi:Mycoplasma protein of unknown function, DUF285